MGSYRKSIEECYVVVQFTESASESVTIPRVRGKSERVKQWKGIFSSLLPNLHQTQIHHLPDLAPKNLVNFSQE